MIEIGAKVKLKQNWRELAKNIDEGILVAMWDQNGVAEQIDLVLGKEAVVIGKCKRYCDLDIGNGFKFHEEWLNKIEEMI